MVSTPWFQLLYTFMVPPCSAPLRKMNDFALGLNHQTKSVCTEASREASCHPNRNYGNALHIDLMTHEIPQDSIGACFAVHLVQVMSLLGKSSLLNAGAIPLAMGGTAVSMVTDGVGSTIRGGAGLLGHLAMDEARVSMTYPSQKHYFTLPCSLAEV